MSPMDVVIWINDSNKILPAGDVRIGPEKLRRFQQQPIAQHRADERCAAEGHRQRGASLRRHGARRRVRRQFDQRPRGRPEVGLLAHPKSWAATAAPFNLRTECATGLTSTSSDIPPSLKANVVFDQSEYVKIAVTDADARRRNGPDTDCSDDPDFPGLGARDHFGLDFDPSLLPGRIPFVECLRRNHQYHGAGRTRLAVLATGSTSWWSSKHLPAYGGGPGYAHRRRTGRLPAPSRCP